MRVPRTRGAGVWLLPNDLEALVEIEALIRGDHRNALTQSLRNDLPVEGIAVVERQIEQSERMRRRIRQDTQAKGADACVELVLAEC